MSVYREIWEHKWSDWVCSGHSVAKKLRCQFTERYGSTNGLIESVLDTVLLRSCGVSLQRDMGAQNSLIGSVLDTVLLKKLQCQFTERYGRSNSLIGSVLDTVLLRSCGVSLQRYGSINMV